MAKIDFRVFIVIIVGLLFLFLGAKGYSWGYLIGSICILTPLIVSEVRSIGAIQNSLSSEIDQRQKVYFLVGFLQSILSIISSLAIIGLVGYGYFFEKDSRFVIEEVFRIVPISIIFWFLGLLFSSIAVHHFLDMWLTKNYRLIEILYSFKVLFIGFGGVFFLLLGFLYLLVR